MFAIIPPKNVFSHKSDRVPTSKKDSCFSENVNFGVNFDTKMDIKRDKKIEKQTFHFSERKAAHYEILHVNI